MFKRLMDPKTREMIPPKNCGHHRYMECSCVCHTGVEKKHITECCVTCSECGIRVSMQFNKAWNTTL